MKRIFHDLSPDLQAIGVGRLSEESVGQICNEYDDVMSALDCMEKQRDTLKSTQYNTLIRLRRQLEEEMVDLLAQL